MQSPLPQSLDSQIPTHDGQFTVSYRCDDSGFASDSGIRQTT